MSSFEVLVLGVGDTFTEQHQSSALVLLTEGFALAVDCPDRYAAVLRAACRASGRSLSLADVEHVLITHLHGDHVNGLEGVAFQQALLMGRRVQLVASPEVRAVIWEQRLQASMGVLWDGQVFQPMGFDDYFEFLPLAWDGVTTVGPFRIRARRTRHHVPTSALLVEADGRTLGYSADTVFDPELIAFLAPADLIIHETNLGPGHTPYASLAALPAALRARMRLIHYPDAFDAETSVIPVLREGEVIALGTAEQGRSPR